MKRLLPLLLALPLAEAAPTASAPATLAKEADLTTITLTPEAEQRLRLQAVAVERRTVPAARLFPGEVVLPLAGAAGGAAPVLGGTLEERLRLADQQAVADGRVAAAKAQVEAASLAVERARKMVAAEAGSARSLEEATSGLGVARAALDTALAQRALLGASVGPQAAPVRPWVKAAVYSGEAAALDAGAPAQVRALAGGARSLAASPVRGPLTANAATATLDWYYELPEGTTLRAGERVAVEIMTSASREDSLVVPFAAVLHDIHGGQWVYVATGPHQYVRRRVQVARIMGGLAVLATGPAPGTRVVTDGSAELFGTEFMTGK